MIHRSAAAALGVVWKLYFSRNTSVLSAIEMLHDIALYKFNIHIHIHNYQLLLLLLLLQLLLLLLLHHCCTSASSEWRYSSAVLKYPLLLLCYVHCSTTVPIYTSVVLKWSCYCGVTLCAVVVDVFLHRHRLLCTRQPRRLPRHNARSTPDPRAVCKNQLCVAIAVPIYASVVLHCDWLLSNTTSTQCTIDTRPLRSLWEPTLCRYCCTNICISSIALWLTVI